jgi:general secretion pathway protein M
MKILAKLKKLNKRERYALMVALGVIGVFIVAKFIIEPFFNRMDQIKTNLQAKIVMLEQMQRLQSEYLALGEKAKIAKSRFDQREKGFTLFSFLDQLAGDTSIKDRISYMKPSKDVQKNSPYVVSRVEMKLESVTLGQLTAYLHGVETSKNMVDIKKISISKQDPKQQLISAVLQVETVEI